MNTNLFSSKLVENTISKILCYFETFFNRINWIFWSLFWNFLKLPAWFLSYFAIKIILLFTATKVCNRLILPPDDRLFSSGLHGCNLTMLHFVHLKSCKISIRLIRGSALWISNTSIFFTKLNKFSTMLPTCKRQLCIAFRTSRAPLLKWEAHELFIQSWQRSNSIRETSSSLILDWINWTEFLLLKELTRVYFLCS